MVEGAKSDEANKGPQVSSTWKLLRTWGGLGCGVTAGNEVGRGLDVPKTNLQLKG